MIDKPILYYLTKIITVITSILIISKANVDMVFSVISTLSFACVFTLEVWLYRLFSNKMVVVITSLVSMSACFFLGLDILFPLFIVLLIHLLDVTIDPGMFYQIIGVSLLLLFFIFTPDNLAFAISMIIIILLLFSRIILTKLSIYKTLNENQNETISELNKKLTDLKSLIKTLKYTTSIEERNRIAARIHDQIGHGISGSIIMLEAALLIMKDNQEKATDNIKRAITNLRDGVDEIRSALKEERADRYLLGINDITAILEEYKVSYNKTTFLHTTGDLDFITMDIWACIHDNLKECLTNVLKHSNASEFYLNIDVFKKIIKVEYKDNGKSSGDFVKGLGLEAIEERTVQAKGRCFFTKGENGFSVTNIFNY
ncbi:hypothetical protein I5677_08805 [Mobilitalea sibirica]|uniref:histidine kinase n=1 Tax=Mobilitalea sibirica TaxID=1462919 RepID=A0A8J7L2M9_9FIRM|nr:histidine kinase [Mobilitalea sibirica]MBH1940988.1 hypothetical protein [Mobilitalea sibirica]